ncbi:hypothetical protein QVD17_06016 [Tagetes erecta]|uniref:Uncharacterized protein n=1 Tax=Tagetes erecta TaxID=13708 RepID=A0AAD8PBY2_TARER|nr:hypothetical protein QVD17_06016 [Tagetes erecta]
MIDENFNHHHFSIPILSYPPSSSIEDPPPPQPIISTVECPPPLTSNHPTLLQPHFALISLSHPLEGTKPPLNVVIDHYRNPYLEEQTLTSSLITPTMSSTTLRLSPGVTASSGDFLRFTSRRFSQVFLSLDLVKGLERT